MKPYNPFDWHWVVDNDESRFWSSAGGAYVQTLPESAGVTRIDSEAALSDLLRPYGMQGPALSIEDYTAAIVAHLDATAASRLYDNAVSIATYVGSTTPQWAAEAAAFVAWRDQIWLYAYAELAKVTHGQRPQPTIVALIDELPALAWPEG